MCIPPFQSNWRWLWRGFWLAFVMVVLWQSCLPPMRAEAPQPSPTPAPNKPEAFVQPTREARQAAVGDLKPVPEKWRRFFQPTPDSRPLPDPRPGEWLAEHPEPPQPFELFLKEKPNRPDRQQGTIYLLPLDEFDEYEPMGGGGTEFDANWEYMKEHDITPKKFIMFTDGYPYGSWGDENYCDTVFIIHGNNTIVPPFGEYAYYDLSNAT